VAQFTIIEKRRGGGFLSPTADWHARVKLEDGRILRVGVMRGSPRRGMYGKRGFTWIGYVNTDDGKRLWDERVPKSLGAHGILVQAGIIRCEHRLKPPKYAGQDRTGERCFCGAIRQADGTWKEPTP
jgi:hypothetical protein